MKMSTVAFFPKIKIIYFSKVKEIACKTESFNNLLVPIAHLTHTYKLTHYHFLWLMTSCQFQKPEKKATKLFFQPFYQQSFILDI